MTKKIKFNLFIFFVLIFCVFFKSEFSNPAKIFITSYFLKITPFTEGDEVANFLINDFIEELKIYDAYFDKKKIEIKRIGRDYDGGYVVPTIALEKSDALLSYGVAGDISFEEEYSTLMNKNSYAYDCSVVGVDIKNMMTKFIPECISSKEYVSGNYGFLGKKLKVSTFNDHLRENGLLNKKIFIKMDIEGAEFESIPDILKYQNTITGISFELHLANNLYTLIKAKELLQKLNKNFLLIHIHNNNHAQGFTASSINGKLSRAIELSYINKNLVDKYEITTNKIYPLPIDMKCAKNLEDFYLEFKD